MAKKKATKKAATGDSPVKTAVKKKAAKKKAAALAKKTAAAPTRKKAASKKATPKKSTAKTEVKKPAALAKKTAAAPARKKAASKKATPKKPAAKKADPEVTIAESAVQQPDASKKEKPTKASARTAPVEFKLDEKNASLIPDVETETQAIGDWLQQHNKRRQPSIFERRWWDDRILSWAMADESVKVQMFRFVDVLPMLKDHQAVSRHLQEYFEEVNDHFPSAVRMVVDHAGPNTVLGRALSMNARSNAVRMAERFISGSTSEEVLASVTKLRKQGFAFSLDLLGEAVVSEPEANRYRNSYSELIDSLANDVNGWSEDTQIDHDDRGPIPRLNVSVKLSALYSQFSPVDPIGTAEVVKKRLRTILRRARRNMAYVHVDMEQYAYKDLTLHIFKDILMEDEFRDFADVGIVIQAYLRDAESDLFKLLQWVAERGTPITVRLVKGAYWDYETVNAEQKGWATPVFKKKWQSDENFERLSRFLLENYQALRPAFASHNLRSLSHAIAWGRKLDVPRSAYEIQMLYGMAKDQAQLFRELGHRVRIYTPFGELIPGMAYLVRRLLENTSNDSFLRHSLAEDIPREKLMAKPSATLSTDQATDKASVATTDAPVFTNEPPLDFSNGEVREEFQAAVDSVAEEFGRDYFVVIDGKRVETRGQLVSRNPSHKNQIVGTVGAASPDDAQDAIDAAEKAFKSWAKFDVNYRAEYLNLLANSLRERRYELAAWQVHECGKTWQEADADVAEAVDFCVYYSQQAIELLAPREVNLAGEENTYYYRPRGVAAVIAPWNFPLAILTGMTAAAIVTGNTVIMKPAEQSSVIAAKLMEIFQDIDLPDGVVNFLPGVGEEIGPVLVGSHEVDIVAFTGSRDVGLEINRSAAETDPRQTHVKKVVAEMGGKNAIIVDADADLDEAVQGVIESAFNYAGQKCSACSRVVVLRSIYSNFVKRLVAAIRSLKVGYAETAGTTVGPVIDEKSLEQIQKHIEIGKEENRLVLEYPLPEGLAEEGYFIGPQVFADVDPSSRLAQEEIFGPVLAVLPVDDLSEAIEVVNDTDYALTAGVFSRSPGNLKRCVEELEVGNLYLNRGTTGALVNRQPFGGFRMSGIGTKAGGPDYLAQFILPVNVTENTLRRGFAPEAE
ncbi:MAG: L-glutamate gamma-semialdehyde dehydrogenase [Planctomycetaceae bacterium]|nr:L-glutamate gamma-semialdehyde dehydrogenase [Planctomycetaceae bacterium]